jgi:hypothetical protein
MKMTVLWDDALYSLTETDQRFRGAYCLRHLDDGGSKDFWKSVNFYETTQRNIPEDSHLQIAYKIDCVTKDLGAKDIKYIYSAI